MIIMVRQWMHVMQESYLMPTANQAAMTSHPRDLRVGLTLVERLQDFE
jgi:hypothetical protein